MNDTLLLITFLVPSLIALTIFAIVLFIKHKKICLTDIKNNKEYVRREKEIKDNWDKYYELKEKNAKLLEEILEKRSSFEIEKEETEKEVTEELSKIITTIDNQLKEKIIEIQRKNTVIFDCPCKHNSIPVEIDLSKDENTYVCPECKNEYVVNITMIPVLRGKIVQEQNLYTLLSTAMEQKQPFGNLE